jgi:hypothetical protein
MDEDLGQALDDGLRGLVSWGFWLSATADSCCSCLGFLTKCHPGCKRREVMKVISLVKVFVPNWHKHYLHQILSKKLQVQSRFSGKKNKKIFTRGLVLAIFNPQFWNEMYWYTTPFYYMFLRRKPCIPWNIWKGLILDLLKQFVLVNLLIGYVTYIYDKFKFLIIF